MSLSDKQRAFKPNGKDIEGEPWYMEYNVREAVKELKKAIRQTIIDNDGVTIDNFHWIEEDFKIAIGEKLI